MSFEQHLSQEKEVSRVVRIVVTGQRGHAARDAAEQLRGLISGGELRPGQRLGEAWLAETLKVSRNTLREAFRMLDYEGLLEHEANKGIRVTRPSRESIVEIYAVRRLLELPALRDAESTHPSTAVMQSAVERARTAQESNDWRRAGSADLDFHHGVVSLTNNSRLTSLHDSLATELRLAFGVINDPAAIHQPFISKNAEILEALVSGCQNDAANLMESYLALSEEIVLDAYSARS